MGSEVVSCYNHKGVRGAKTGKHHSDKEDKVGSVNPRRKNRGAACDVEAQKGMRNKESPNLDTMNKGLHLGFHDGAHNKMQPILVPMAQSITGDTLRTTPYY
ncbi:unnamed protein product [Prunus armeniaca]|uniref:Uncharacterized protein n=1 Tax=Prunus armeniaca TaxID=36596 RepID=A0A6J5VFC2_PRUAR|nr:unnamed protein product [Prunus armeniaca]